MSAPTFSSCSEVSLRIRESQYLALSIPHAIDGASAASMHDCMLFQGPAQLFLGVRWQMGMPSRAVGAQKAGEWLDGHASKRPPSGGASAPSQSHWAPLQSQRLDSSSVPCGREDKKEAPARGKADWPGCLVMLDERYEGVLQPLRLRGARGHGAWRESPVRGSCASVLTLLIPSC